jgi:hypothetical protein
LDWQKLVHDRFADQRYGAEIEPEVTEELAHYLQDFFEAGIDKGVPEREAARCALAEVRNWGRLARKINHARNGGQMFKQRIQALWMPGFAAAILTVAASLTVNRVASTVFAGPHIAMFVYGAWLLFLTGIGALAAYWSRRAGGSIAKRTAAALLPAALILGALGALVTNPDLKMAVIASVFSPCGVRIPGMLSAIPNSVVGGILLPAVALLAGALPFLREKPMGSDLRAGTA